MRTKTMTVRIGEMLGPVDPSYDPTQHNWGPNKGGCNPETTACGFARILELAADPDGWVYCPSGFTSFPVVRVGMYDGWPFWRPTPAIGYIGPLNSVEWAFFYELSAHNTRKGSPSRWGQPRDV